MRERRSLCQVLVPSTSACIFEPMPTYVAILIDLALMLLVVLIARGIDRAKHERVFRQTLRRSIERLVYGGPNDQTSDYRQERTEDVV